MQTTLTSKGQVTFPKHIREALSLTPGCELEFGVNQAGNWCCARMERHSRADLTGSMKLPGAPTSNGAPMN